MSNLSYTYRLLKVFGLNYSIEEYGQISLINAAKRMIRSIFNSIILKYCMYSVFLMPLNYRRIRPILWRWMGCKVGRDVFIGYEVWMDFTNAKLIEIEDRVHIANRSLLLCHQRNLKNYRIGGDYSKLPYNKEKIILKEGCAIGMGTIILPGVTIGKGAIIGAGSLVNCDIPDWTIATGTPAKVKRNIPEKTS